LVFGRLFGSAFGVAAEWARLYVTSWSATDCSDCERARKPFTTVVARVFGGKRTATDVRAFSNDTDRQLRLLSVSLSILSATRDDYHGGSSNAVHHQLLALCIGHVPSSFGSCTASAKIASWSINPLAAGAFEQCAGRHHPGHPRSESLCQEHREVNASNEPTSLGSINDRLNIICSFLAHYRLSYRTWLLAVGFSVWEIFPTKLTGVIVLLSAPLAGFTQARIDVAHPSTHHSGPRQRPSHFEILDRVPSVPEPTKPVHPDRLQAASNPRVRFKYGAREVLHGSIFKLPRVK